MSKQQDDEIEEGQINLQQQEGSFEHNEVEKIYEILIGNNPKITNAKFKVQWKTDSQGIQMQSKICDYYDCEKYCPGILLDFIASNCIKENNFELKC